MNETARILCAIPDDRFITIHELWKPVFGVEPTDLEGISTLLKTLETLADQSLIITRRGGMAGRIMAMRLTPLGAERAREALQETRR